MSNNTNHHADRLLVVTPTLGESLFLDRTMASVQALKLNIVHVLSVPAPRCAELQARYPHTLVIPDLGKEKGLYGALNTALAHQGTPWDWFTYINDDDRLLPGYADVFKRHLRLARPEPVFYGAVELVDEAERELARIAVESDPAWFPALLAQGISPLSQQGNTFHREVIQRIGGFNPQFRLCGDFDFWLRAYASGFAFKYYNTRVGQFRLRQGQLSSDTRLTLREQEEIFRAHLQDVPTTLKKRIARWRFRTCNLPKYLSRFRTHGLRTSYQMLDASHAK